MQVLRFPQKRQSLLLLYIFLKNNQSKYYKTLNQRRIIGKVNEPRTLQIYESGKDHGKFLHPGEEQGGGGSLGEGTSWVEEL